MDWDGMGWDDRIGVVVHSSPSCRESLRLSVCPRTAVRCRGKEAMRAVCGMLTVGQVQYVGTGGAGVVVGGGRWVLGAGCWVGGWGVDAWGSGDEGRERLGVSEGVGEWMPGR